MTRHPRVVVTGMGLVCSAGDGLCADKNAYWDIIREGRNTIRPWHPSGVDDFPVSYAATIDFDVFRDRFSGALEGAPLLERRGYFGYIAAKLAFEDAGLQSGGSIGAAACSGVPEVHESELIALAEAGVYPEGLARFTPNQHSGLATLNDAMASAVARSLGLNGPVLNINGACAGAAQAIGHAYKAIRRGEVTAMLAGGADSATNLRTMSGLHLLGATATTSSRQDRLCCPFDKARSGLVAGEGGAFLVLENADHAEQRGAKIYGEVLGYGSSLDAYKVTAPHPEGKGAYYAMQGALQQAGLHAADIDYINAHGTSTPLNDQVETQVIKALFTERVPPVSSTKSMIGHWISAAAAPEAMATLLGIYHRTLPPTINLEDPDPECDLDYVSNGARPAHIRYALCNSFGFGGINACLAFGEYGGGEHE